MNTITCETIIAIKSDIALIKNEKDSLEKTEKLAILEPLLASVETTNKHNKCCTELHINKFIDELSKELHINEFIDELSKNRSVSAMRFWNENKRDIQKDFNHANLWLFFLADFLERSLALADKKEREKFKIIRHEKHCESHSENRVITDIEIELVN